MKATERGLPWSKIQSESSRRKRTARVTLLGVALIAGMLLAAEQTYATEHSLSSVSPDAILEKVQKRIFVEIGSPPKEIFVRWKNDVHMGVIADYGIPVDTLRVFLDDVSDVRDATNQNFILFGKTSNFVVFFSQDLDRDLQIHEDLLSQFFLSSTLYRQYFEGYKEKKSTCTSKNVVDAVGAIERSLLFVSVSPDHSLSDINECLARNLLGSLGVLGAFDEDFFPEDAGAKISELDKITLKLLYDPNVPLGASKEQALPELRRLLGAMLGRG